MDQAAMRLGIAATLALLASISLSGCGESASAQSRPRTPERVYETTCGYCHGHNVGPVIRGRQLPPEAVIDFVRRGHGAMPAFRPTEITNDELKALADWVHTSKPSDKEHGK